MTPLASPPELVDTTRRSFLAGGAAALAVLLAGCADDSSPSGGAQGAGVRLQTPLGPVEVPREPERVVAMYANDVDLAITLELPMVGASTANGAGKPEGFAAHQEGSALEGVEPLQTYPEANYEAIAALGPDLIIDSVAGQPQRYRTLTGIAPTVNYAEVVFGEDGGRPSWRRALRFMAEPFGRRDQAESFIADYEAAAGELRERLTGSAVGSVAVVTPYDGQLYVQTDPGLFIADLVGADLGLPEAPFLESLREESEDAEVLLSAEQLGRVDADTLLVLVYPDEKGRAMADSGQLLSVAETPLWSRIRAVEEDRVVLLPSELNFPSPLCAREVVDLLDASLTELSGF